MNSSVAQITGLFGASRVQFLISLLCITLLKLILMSLFYKSHQLKAKFIPTHADDNFRGYPLIFHPLQRMYTFNNLWSDSWKCCISDLCLHEMLRNGIMSMSI